MSAINHYITSPTMSLLWLTSSRPSASPNHLESAVQLTAWLWGLMVQLTIRVTAIRWSWNQFGTKLPFILSRSQSRKSRKKRLRWQRRLRQVWRDRKMRKIASKNGFHWCANLAELLWKTNELFRVWTKSLAPLLGIYWEPMILRRECRNFTC